MSKLSQLISVIIPVYNVEQYLSECLESVLGQTYSNLEIILIDDGSTDSSGRVCDEFAAKDKRIKVIHRVNEGVATARNLGLDIANGDYISFIDSDDYISRNIFELAVNVFNQKNVDIVAFDCNFTDNDGKIINSLGFKKTGELNREESLRELVAGKIANYYCNKIFKRQVFDGVRCPEGRVWEDLATCYKIFLNANSVYMLPEKAYFYRQRNNSISKVISESALVDIFYAKFKRYECLKSIYPDIADLAFADVTLEALKLYDRSLWKPIDKLWLDKAIEFLSENKQKILSQKPNAKFVVYFKFPVLYKAFRVFKHNVGDVLKSLSEKLHK